MNIKLNWNCYIFLLINILRMSELTGLTEMTQMTQMTETTEINEITKIKPIHWTNLNRKGVYIVETENGIYKGMHLTQPRFKIQFNYIILSHVTITKNGKKYKLPDALFNKTDKFYDAEIYINNIKDIANRARQQMESRALDKLLKRVVNEHFQW
jgi:hypothetical protein